MLNKRAALLVLSLLIPSTTIAQVIITPSRTLSTGGGGGGGDVTGPASSVDSNFACFDGTTGKLIKDCLVSAASFLSSSASSTQNGSFGDIQLRDDTTPSHFLTITNAENLTANRILSVVTGDSARTLTFSANATIGGTNSGDQLIFTTIAVSGQSDVVSDVTSDTLTLIAGTNIVITTSSIGDSVTISSTGAVCGSDTQVIFNDAAACGADAGLTFNKASDDLTVSGQTTSGNFTTPNGGALRSGLSAGNTLLLQARDVDGTAWTTFGTLTSNNTPTFDLASSVTKGGSAIATASNNLSFFSSTTSSQLATLLPDETGSGAAVFGTNPTISNPTISTITNTGTLTLPTTTDTLVGRATPDTLTNKNIDCEATGNNCTVPSMLTFIAAVCQNTTASLGFSTEVTNPAVATCQTGSNTQYATADFVDAGTRSIQGHFSLPLDWTGNIDLAGKWSTSAVTGSVVWQIECVCVSDDETADPAFNATEGTATDAAKGTANRINTFSILNLDTSNELSGCAPGDELYFRFFRDPSNGSDTIGATARLLEFTFTIRRTM